MGGDEAGKDGVGMVGLMVDMVGMEFLCGGRGGGFGVVHGMVV